MGYHLVNVLLHSAVCFLYVQLCGVVFGEAWPALIAGLLFAVHPIHTEAVSCFLLHLRCNVHMHTDSFISEESNYMKNLPMLMESMFSGNAV